MPLLLGNKLEIWLLLFLVYVVDLWGWGYLDEWGRAFGGGFSMIGLLYIKEENFWPAMSTYPETRQF